MSVTENDTLASPPADAVALLRQHGPLDNVQHALHRTR